MKSVGAFEGKTHFSALILAASRGETTVVTRKGVPVAKIVPVERSGADAGAALDRILRRRLRIGVPIRDLIEEGRKR